jgi:16S rRNA (uracil1498-N3)-methyltransferase
MHRFFLPPEQCRGASLTLVEAEAHHALHVVRVARGDRVAVLDGAGRQFLCEVAGLARHEVILVVREQTELPRLPHRVTLVQAVAKARSMEWIVQKATELGASRIVPILAERSVPQVGPDDAARKIAKWRGVAIEAIKQCGSPWLPVIEGPASLDAFLARAESFDLSLVASRHSGAAHPRTWLESFRARQGRPARDVAVAIGPEGDFTEGEVQRLCTAGAKPMTLGPLVLRCETAAVSCLAILNYELGA